MKYIWCYLVSCLLCLACSPTQNKNIVESNDLPEWYSKTEPEYDKQRQVIYFKEQLKQDIKGDIAFPINMNPNPFNTHFVFSCQFTFFNYGGEICLFNGCGEDLFISGFGTINCAYVITKDNIDIVTKKHSEKYGDWALVNLTIDNNYVKDVYMTPLSMKAYKDGNDDNFIFIQFVTRQKYMNVLFCGGTNECIIVNYCPNVILPDRALHNIEALNNGPGQFWHQI